MRHSLRQLALIGLMGLLAVAFVAACGGETEPDPTESPTNTPAPTSTPMPTPVPPTATPAPTTAPTVAPTPEPDAMPAMPAFEFSPDMRWGNLIDTLSESEQACISSELGDQLASVRDTPVFSEAATEPSQVSISAAFPRRRPLHFSWRPLLRSCRRCLKRLKPVCKVC